MIKIQATIEESLNRRLKEYLLDESGKLREGQSKFVADAIREKLDRLEAEKC